MNCVFPCYEKGTKCKYCGYRLLRTYKAKVHRECTKRTELCEYWLGPIGQTIKNPGCARHIPVHGCEKFGKCTIFVYSGDYECCQLCNKYKERENDT